MSESRPKSATNHGMPAATVSQGDPFGALIGVASACRSRKDAFALPGREIERPCDHGPLLADLESLGQRIEADRGLAELVVLAHIRERDPAGRALRRERMSARG